MAGGRFIGCSKLKFRQPTILENCSENNKLLINSFREQQKLYFENKIIKYEDSTLINHLYATEIFLKCLKI